MLVTTSTNTREAEEAAADGLPAIVVIAGRPLRIWATPPCDQKM